MCSGFLVIDKPKDWTSFDVVRYVRKSLRLKSVGHAGTLDPMATGVLVLLLGRATRLMDALLTKPKTYHGHIRLGIATTTDDITGDVIKHCPVPNYSSAEKLAIIESLSGNYCGRITQVPPIYSALKIQGKRCYELARSDQAVTPTSRTVEIYSSKFFFLSNAEIGFEICCSSGTYIRSIARDIGVALGLCATLAALRRSVCSGFKVEQAAKIENLHLDINLNDNYFSLNNVQQLFPTTVISENDLTALYHGKQDRLREILANLPSNLSFPHVLSCNDCSRFALLQWEPEGVIKMKCL